MSSCSLICKRWHKKLYEAIYFSTTLGVVLSNQRIIDSTGEETRQIFSHLFVKAKKCECLIRVFYASHSRCWIEQLIVTYTNKIRNAETRKAVLQTEQKTHILPLELQLSEVRESLARLSSGPSQLLIANRAGVVSRIETPNRTSVTPGQPLLYISSEEQSNSGLLIAFKFFV